MLGMTLQRENSMRIKFSWNSYLCRSAWIDWKRMGNGMECPKCQSICLWLCPSKLSSCLPVWERVLWSDLTCPVLCKKAGAPLWLPWRLGSNYVFIPAGDPQSMPTTAIGTSPRTVWLARNIPCFNLKRLRNGIQHVEKKYLEKIHVWSETNQIPLSCFHCSSGEHALNQNISSPLGLNTDENFRHQIIRLYELA